MIQKLRRRLAVVFTIFTGAVLTAALLISFLQLVEQTRQSGDIIFLGTMERIVDTLVLGKDPPVALRTGDAVICLRADGQMVEEQVPGLAQAPSAFGSAISPELKITLFDAAKTTAEDKNYAVKDAVHYSVTVMTGVVEAGEIDGEPVSPTPFFYTMGGTVDFALGPDDVFDVKAGDTSYRAAYFTLKPDESAGNEMLILEHQDGQTQEAAWDLAPSYEAAILENRDRETRQLVQDGLHHLLIWLGGLGLLFVANWALAGLVLRSTREGLRRQTEFVAAASHELRSPLAVIRASLSAAKEARQDADEPQAEKFNSAAMDETERMSRLVDDLLLLAGGDAGSWKLDKAPVDLDTLLIDTAESYTPLAKAKGLRLELCLPDETLPKPGGDAERLRQILAVLLDNALQYAPEGTAVKLSAEARRGKVSISVSDCGPGIPDEEKERVFDRFYRADKSRHDKAHFGLGLSVARELAWLHGGKLTVADAPGGGGAFTLTLPAG